MRTPLLALSLAFLIGPAAGADVYRWVDADGTVHYTDQPRPGAERIRVEPLQTFTPRQVPAAAGTPEPGQEEPAARGYERFTVVRPGADEGVRANDGRVPVELALEPPLRSGHRIEVTVDGETLRGSAPTSFTLPGMARGTHRLSAVVRDADDRIVAETGPVTFHVLRVSAGPRADAAPQAPQAPQAPRAPNVPQP
jgi:hypothetical protein